MRSAAEAWRDASTVAEQEAIFTKHGVRWSPFWRLPYWNPCRQLVVDSMHCLLEGLVKFHCLQALQLTEAAANAKPVRPPAFTFPFSTPDDADDSDEDDSGIVSTVQDPKLLSRSRLDIEKNV